MTVSECQNLKIQKRIRRSGKRLQTETNGFFKKITEIKKGIQTTFGCPKRKLGGDLLFPTLAYSTIGEEVLNC